MPRTDLEMMQGLANGEEAALAECYDRHAPRLLGLLVRWLKSRTDADDVLQEVFWQAWRQASDYDEQRASPLGWLILLARSRAFDLLRKRQTEQSATAQARPQQLPETPARIEAAESRDRVRAALDRLPLEQQTAICSAFFDGLTYQQVADREGIPEGTAKTRIRLGLQRLRSYLHDEGNS